MTDTTISLIGASWVVLLAVVALAGPRMRQWWSDRT